MPSLLDPAAAANRRVLIVDDTPAIHADFAKLLAAPSAPEAARDAALDAAEAMLFGGAPARATTTRFELASALQGQDAVALAIAARAAGRPFAVAFVDMRMPPGWDGVETIERLTAADPELQIVVCSAYSDYSGDELRARLGERDDLFVIKKPFDAIEVVQACHALTAKWALGRLARTREADLAAAVEARTAELRAEMRERARVEDELRVANQREAIGRLASGIAHEIATPLQYISYNAEFVRDQLDLVFAGEPPPPDLHGDLGDAIASITRGVERITATVRSMRELAHPGTREAAPADLNRTLRAAVEVASATTRPVADVDVDLATLPPVRCHAGELSQVFVNLIVNAAQAMAGRPRGRLGVRSRVDGDDVVVSISDTGTGIPDAIRDRVFDRSFTTKPVGEGTGQGLAISRDIVVDHHGGRLDFESTVGAGTTFHVRVPIAGPPAARADRAATAA